ncbi:K Homology domain, type 1 [Kalmanozyma brasiliensis GHG001]|uniref:K Homology domain-containing protein n=1 Tax=Kalmanozyma brasiliensis (strain GHG001) TaxID=1365824 RepID=V5E389_KALBG|nr:K Homology domain, type 1 [Kalmanozyma brasiliensis GHG001]EST04616.1 K Homology domain, type 1 [Kalmanozyma brasiliensis GHG001]
MSSRWDSPNNEASSSSASASAAAAAAAAAAKIAAQFASKGQPSSSSNSEAPQSKEKDAHDAEFTHDIEINDQRNRYMLTKGQTQQQIHRETGASVTTKGTWYPDKALATKEDPPLFLHVSAISQDILDAAIAKINELMAQDVPQLVEDRHQRRLDYENQRPPPRERRRWPEEKILVNLESIRNFNVRSKIVGPGGMFVKYIQSETGTRVQIKGLGSGFIESDTGAELNEPMHIAIAGPEDEQIQAAKALAEDLMEVVRAEWQKAYDSMGQGYGGGQRGGYGGYDGGAPRGGGYGRSQGYGRGGSPVGAGGYGHQQQQQQQQGGWDQQRGGWSQQQQSYPYNSSRNGDPAPPPTDNNAPPPPPPEDDAPPPPPTDSASHRQPAAPSQQRGNGISQHAASPAQSRSQPVAAAKPAKSPEEEALDKYWREYVEWESSFKAYHNRMPTKEEGGQDVPPQYRK